MEKNERLILLFARFINLRGLFRMRVFYKILSIIIVMILFLIIQAEMNLSMIDTMQKTSKTLSGESTYRMRQISQLKQSVAKLQVAYIETLTNVQSASTLRFIIRSMEESTVFLWLSEERQQNMAAQFDKIKKLLDKPPSLARYMTLKNELLDLTLLINEIEADLSSSLVQGLVNNDRFLNESRWNGVLIGIVSALLALFLGIIVVHSISKPLQKMIQQMKAVSEGNMAVRFHSERRDEFGVVMDGFDDMIVNIVEMQDSIKKNTADLELKNMEMERFIYTVSHDLQSPLITIKGFAGSILRDLESGRTQRIESDLRRVEGAATKMQQFLKDLLELSRIGRIINPTSGFSMTEAALDVVEMLHGVIVNSGAAVMVERDMPVVKGDRQRITEVLQNLIENAIKFSKTTERPVIKIGWLREETGPVFYITDNGQGIDPAYQQKIFGLFDKLEPNSEGTGIGLAIVKRIIELHQGRIWVESSLGNGASFYFTLNEEDMG